MSGGSDGAAIIASMFGTPAEQAAASEERARLHAFADEIVETGTRWVALCRGDIPRVVTGLLRGARLCEPYRIGDTEVTVKAVADGLLLLPRDSPDGFAAISALHLVLLVNMLMSPKHPKHYPATLNAVRSRFSDLKAMVEYRMGERA